MTDDTPTQRLPETPAPAATTGDPEARRSRTLLYVLIGIGAALLIAIVVLIGVLLSGGSPTPNPTESGSPSPTPTASDSPSPTPTASETPTTAPEPEPEEPEEPAAPSAIVSYTVSTREAGCPDTSSSVPLTFNWNTTGSEVDFGIGTDFAESASYQKGLPAVGGITVNYQCGNESTKFAIAVHFNGEVIGRQTITVTR